MREEEEAYNRVEAVTVEEGQQIAVEDTVDEDGLAHVLLQVVHEVLAQSRDVRVAVLLNRQIAVLQHAAQVVVVLHAHHIAAVHHQHLQRREVVEALLVLDLLQRQRRGDDHVAVVEVRVQSEGVALHRQTHTEAIYASFPREVPTVVVAGKDPLPPWLEALGLLLVVVELLHELALAVYVHLLRQEGQQRVYEHPRVVPVGQQQQHLRSREALVHEGGYGDGGVQVHVLRRCVRRVVFEGFLLEDALVGLLVQEALLLADDHRVGLLDVVALCVMRVERVPSERGSACGCTACG